MSGTPITSAANRLLTTFVELSALAKDGWVSHESADAVRHEIISAMQHVEQHSVGYYVNPSELKKLIAAAEEAGVESVAELKDTFYRRGSAK